MRLKLTSLVLLLSTFIITNASAADDAVSAKLAVVDIQKIMRESLAAKDLQSQLEKKKAEYQSEITKQEQDLQKTDKDLAEQKGVLSNDAFEKKRNAFKGKVEDVQRKVQTRRTQLEGAYANAINDIQNTVLKIIDEIAKERGFSVVLPTSQILYSLESLNISDDVLKQLDKKLAKINLVIPEVKETKKDAKKEKKKKE